MVGTCFVYRCHTTAAICQYGKQHKRHRIITQRNKKVFAVSVVEVNLDTVRLLFTQLMIN